MKFEKALETLPEEDFIQPYSIAKKLNKDDTEIIFRGDNLPINYEDPSAEYLSLYGALSFIFKNQSFLEIGGMNEELYGWAREDQEFYERLTLNGRGVTVLNFKGIHLWHPIEFTVDSTPKISNSRDMAVVTCFFNWRGNINPVRNLHRFIRQMQADGVPLYGVELSVEGNFETTGNPNWQQIKVNNNNICFQKEACINIVEKIIPSQYKKIAWIDADLYFTNKNWYEETSTKLNTYKLVQLYSECEQTDKHGHIVNTVPGLISRYGKVPLEVWYRHAGYPGGAWAARRDLWSCGGVYPYCLMGGGDSLFIYTIFGQHGHPSFDIKLSGENIQKKYNIWKNKIISYISPEDVTYVDGSIIHEWHGDPQKRSYATRYGLIEKFDENNRLFLNEQGVLEYEGPDTGKITREITNYFISRNEDGNNSGKREDFTIYYTTPYDVTKNLGKYYNDFMRMLPNDEDFACFVDGDTIFTTADYGHAVHEVVSYYPNIGCFTCCTNRVGFSTQIAPGVNVETNDIAYHRNFGKKLYETYGTQCKDITLVKSPVNKQIYMSGVMILLQKKLWKKIGGFHEDKILGIDNHLHKAIMLANEKIYLMQGIYIYHWYRWPNSKDKSHLL